ncbi:MAG: DNA gyrase subunit A [Rhodospirillaceae bacterium]|nr:DNA gyrase subunit A [Rhodospirillaceae bacterium]
MKKSYLDYAMSVIVSRALPDVRDGLKPVHRRILYAMHENGYEFNKPYRKSARVVGDVMGKYHPHGDSAIYDAMVRMAQNFSMRLPLLDGQGNFGSMDGDPPAAMRYTEIRMAESAHFILEDIEKETVDFQDNYDGSSKEPVVLPSRVPNLLINGAGGIAVGMATNIPPHNLGEIIDACCALINKSPEEDIDLSKYVKGPDFPTGGIILGRNGIKEAFKTGRGSILIRSKVHIEELPRDKNAIIVTEIPFQVNKSHLVEQIADVARNKKVEGISDLRDESDRDGVRIVIELSRSVNPEIVLNQLYKFTRLQNSFGVNMLSLKAGRPELMGLEQMLEAFIDFRQEVITRRTKFDLKKARNRAQILVGLAIAVSNIDEVIKLIRKSKDPNTAKKLLLEKRWSADDVKDMVKLIDDPRSKIVRGEYKLSDDQAKAILELRLQRLTALGRDEIDIEIREISLKIKDFLEILRSRSKMLAILKDELLFIKNRFNNNRRTEIQDTYEEHEEEDLIQSEEMVITVSHLGYIKRVPLSTYRAQKRGGKGRSGMSTRDEDFVSQVFVVNTHTPILFFSSYGKVYRLKTYKLPLGTPQARGKPMVNLLPIADGEVIQTLLPLNKENTNYKDFVAVFVTANGLVRPIGLDNFERILSTGLKAIKLNQDDKLISVVLATKKNDILLAASSGKCIRFSMKGLRVFGGRNTSGVKGMNLTKDDSVVSMTVLNNVEVTTEIRSEYLQAVSASRRLNNSESKNNDNYLRDKELSELLKSNKFRSLKEKEEYILSVTENGYGKRTSAYEYRLTNRGGSGIINIITSKRNGPVVGSFSVENKGQIMLVTDRGKLIRSPILDVRIAGRNTQGVTLFNTSEDEKVVSVASLAENVDE